MIRYCKHPVYTCNLQALNGEDLCLTHQAYFDAQVRTFVRWFDLKGVEQT